MLRKISRLFCLELILRRLWPVSSPILKDVSRCHRGVQVSARDTETTRLAAAKAAAEASAAEERERRLHAESQLAAERTARLAAIAELEKNSQRLLELAGAAGAGAGAEGCLRALEEQLRSAEVLATRQREEIDALRSQCNKIHSEACSSRETSRVLEARLAEAEREAGEMQDFLAAETGALSDSLREAEGEIVRLSADLERRFIFS
ncbi:unnamed protein product [Leptidea sinapis]|uniref:Myosin tail domain-containing protein n=1 Tax=Leptidea sinapis TaxID=189913 RepID=A0A5E4R1Q5_9NEOP|nr:unnamed protein product [Leptidea sinapis]